MTMKRTFLRDVHSLMKTVASVTADQVSISLEEVDDKNWDRYGYMYIVAEVAPSDGAYKGGKFKFKIFPVSDYPTLPPKVRCVTDIYHPNIDSDDQEDKGTNICVSLLEYGEWDANMNLEHCIQAILFLFYNPNMEDALYSESVDLTQEKFEENVKISLEGGEVKGRVFERNYGLCAKHDNTAGSKLTNQDIELNKNMTVGKAIKGAVRCFSNHYWPVTYYREKLSIFLDFFQNVVFKLIRVVKNL